MILEESWLITSASLPIAISRPDAGTLAVAATEDGLLAPELAVGIGCATTPISHG